MSILASITVVCSKLPMIKFILFSSTLMINFLAVNLYVFSQ